jgi:serine/threonine-protein kinase
MQMVPNVVGMPLSTAVQTLAEGGFAISREPDQPSATVAAGSVMIQVPQAGAMVPPGTEVFLVVSSGPPGVRVPKVVGLIQANATETLHNSGLVARVEQQRSATVPNGVVIAQIPDAGTVVQPGTVVKIVVSAGNLISVPNVIGMTEAEAQRAIQAAGLATTYPNLSGHSPSVQIGQVESETPSAGTLVPPGTTVYINVRSS